MGRFLEPDHSAGDESTIGGYEAVHGRPAALEGPDGFAYSVAILSDATRRDMAIPESYGAYFLFLRWRRVGEEGVEGHLESDFIEFATTPEAARAQLGAWPVVRVQEFLNGMVAQARS